MAAGRLSGLVMIRPVRMALLVPPELPALRRAVQWATSTWGGAYTPFLDPAAPEMVIQVATGLGVDALYSVRDDPTAQALASTPGFEWHGRGEWGPYEQPKPYLSARLLTSEWLLDRLERPRLSLAHWTEVDPLADLLAMWLGSYGDELLGASLQARFVERAAMTDVDPSRAIELAEGITPIALTAHEITYAGDIAPRGFVVIDPTDPRDLLTFWNARAFGGTVFPWPLGQTDRIAEPALKWARQQTEAGTFSGSRGGDGRPLPPHAIVVLRPADTSIPADLGDLLASAGVTPHPDWPYVPHGWTGVHPFRTDFQRSFEAVIEPTEWSARIALPDFTTSARREPTVDAMTIAAQVDISGERGLGAGRWATIPNVRGLSPLLGRAQVMSPVRRPTSGGRVYAIPVSSEYVTIEVLPAMAVVTKLLEDSPWECSQSDNGRFASRLADLLGGPGTDVANEPAVREVLASTVRSPLGKGIDRLRGVAQRNCGAWPAYLATDAKRYADVVVRRLTECKLLRPHLSLRCPACAIAMTVRPEDLASLMTCEMCSVQFPLGYALAVARPRQISWRFRLPPDIGEDRILEATALLAAASAVGFGALLSGASPHQFGVSLATPAGPGRPRRDFCEIDLLMILDERGRSEIIVGEVKNRNPIDSDDVQHLLTVQKWFLGRGLDCYPLFATLQDAMSQEEVAILRSACEAAPMSLGSQVYPLLPIILVSPDLSAPPFTPAHPRSWRSPGQRWETFAVETCKRNLGLVDIELSASPGAPPFSCRWV